jgi:hypothetical protein
MYSFVMFKYSYCYVRVCYLRVFCFIVLFCVLFVCKCVVDCCHRVTNRFQLTDISYHISYHIISYHIIYRISMIQAVSACPSTRRAAFNPRRGHVGFVVEKVTLGHFFPSISPLPCQYHSTISPLPCQYHSTISPLPCQYHFTSPLSVPFHHFTSPLSVPFHHFSTLIHSTVTDPL